MASPLIIGGEGQLARAFKTHCPEALFINRTVIDLAYPEKIEAALNPCSPSVVINAAAYTQVDKAETEEALAMRINAESPVAIAKWCASRSIPFIHFSSDYVFDGGGSTPWKETDKENPVNAYGRTKYAGEKAIAKIDGTSLIFRTSWVYDAQGKNFLNTIIKLACAHEELRIIDDQFGAPTYAPHLAKAVLTIIEKGNFPTGVYHLCNGGEASWYGFANAIIGQARNLNFPIKVKNIIPIPASEYPLPAPRPHNSRLDCHKAYSMFGIEMPDWKEGLAECMGLKREHY
jgi:dTDP-4-dehydrorhamnose reductase